jgi:hypothetical protein
MPKRTPSGRAKRTRDHRPEPRVAASLPPREASPATPRRDEAAPSAPSASVRTSMLANVRRPARRPGQTLITDYSYVLTDLRRIATLAVAAVVILVALTFVIR